MIPNLRGAMICAVIVALVVACNIPLLSPTPGVISTLTLPPDPTATSAVNTPSPASSTKPPASLPPVRTRYEFDVLLDTTLKRAVVDERILFTNPSTNPLSEVTLAVSPNFNPDVFTIKSVRWGDESEVQNYLLKGEILTIPLPADLDVGQEGNILLSYQLDLPEGEGWLNDTGSQLNFGDWYPFLPVFNEEVGFMTYARAKVGEHLVYDLADYEVALRLTSPDPGYVVAASAPAERTENGWYYSLPAARSFAFSVSDQFTVSETYSNGIQILSYSFPQHTGQGEVARDVTGDALSLYEELYGQYPHPSLSVVEADFPDGMEFDGLYFLGESYYQQYQGNPLSYLVTIAAHETAHQWFYGIVGNDPALAPWLDESLATYSEILYYEKYFPEIGGNAWWNFRGIPYPTNNGCVDGSIYDFGGFKAYVNCIYLDGAQFLMNLRKLIGDTDFFDFIKDYVDSNRNESGGKLSEPSVFFQILRHYAGEELNNFIRGYFTIPEPVNFGEELNS